MSICRPFPLTPKDREDTLKWLSGRGRGEREARGRGVIADSDEKGWMEEVYTHTCTHSTTMYACVSTHKSEPQLQQESHAQHGTHTHTITLLRMVTRMSHLTV